MKPAEKKGVIASVNFLKEIIDIINDAIILVDVNANILFVNQAVEDLFGYSSEEMINNKINLLFMKEDHKYYLPNIIKLTTDDDGFKGELALLKKNGKKRAVYISTYFYYRGSKNSGIIIIIINDIASIKTLEKSYAESQNLAYIGALTRGIVHEIRNPLVSLIGFSRRICKNLEEDDKNRSYVDIVNDDAIRLEKILKYLEDFANLPHPSYKQVNILDLINTVIENVHQKTEDIKIIIKVNDDFDANKCLFIDKALTLKALEHVAQNAIEAISSHGSIEFEINSLEEYISINITDSGCGIPDNYLKRIFDPFFTTKIGHLGLNLSSVKRIIEEQGGYVATSSNVGEGSSFNIMLLKDRRTALRTKKLH